MNAKDAISTALRSTHNILNMYLSDLSDQDLTVRPVPGANHIAWQVGHLILSEHGLLKQVPGLAVPELPAGFADKHAQPKAADDSPGWGTKAEYLRLFGQTREATLVALAKMPDSALDTPTEGRMKDFAPTLGALFILVANHTMMHSGQFSVVRRKLGKPVLF